MEDYTYKKTGEYTNNVTVFDCACKYFTPINGRWKDASVYCNIASMVTDSCATCGWNPEVSAERLRKLTGDKDK